MGRLSALVPFALAACTAKTPATGDAPAALPDASPASDLDDGATSGTRLKLEWYAFSDGTRQWAGLYDSERKETCSPSDEWNSGTYCMPQTSGDVVYKDAGCTQPQIDEYSGLSCEAPAAPYAVDETYDDCSDTWTVNHLYMKGAATGGTSYYYKYSATDCEKFDVVAGFESLYAVRSEVVPSELVQLTLSAASGAGAIGVRAWTSADGAVLPATMHDVAGNFDCSPQYYGDSAGSALCVPADAEVTDDDRNATCTEPMLAVDNTCASAPTAYVAMDPSGYACPASLDTYYSVGALIAPAPGNLYQPFGSECDKYTSDTTDDDYYAVGSAVPLVSLERTPDTDGSHRIQLIHYGDGSALHFRDPTYLYDSQEQVVCTPTDDGSGNIRCIPDSNYSVTTDYFYSDSSCNNAVPIVDLYTGPTSCPAPIVPSYVRVSTTTSGCEESYQLYLVGGKAGTLYYPYGGSDFDTCAKYTPDEEVLYTLGSAVSTSNFVTATLVTDE